VRYLNIFKNIYVQLTCVKKASSVQSEPGILTT